MTGELTLAAAWMNESCTASRKEFTSAYENHHTNIYLMYHKQTNTQSLSHAIRSSSFAFMGTIQSEAIIKSWSFHLAHPSHTKFLFFFYSEKFIRNFYDNRSLVTVAFDHYNFQHRKISGTKWINERKKKPQSKWVWGSWLGFLFIRNCIRLIDGSSKTDHIITQRACIHRTQINGHANFQFLI